MFWGRRTVCPSTHGSRLAVQRSYKNDRLIKLTILATRTPAELNQGCVTCHVPFDILLSSVRTGSDSGPRDTSQGRTTQRLGSIFSLDLFVFYRRPRISPTKQIFSPSCVRESRVFVCSIFSLGPCSHTRTSTSCR